MPSPGPIYLDNHATTRCDPRVVQAMLPYFTERFGNAASTAHTYGMEAQAAVEHARTQLANLIGASPKEIVWTSGATESNNLAIMGVAEQNRSKGRHLITSNIEHDAVLDACTALEGRGWDITILPVDSDGRISVSQVTAAIRPDTVLVSVMMANNEIGVIQPIADLGALCRDRGVLFHTDAVQALGRIPIDVQAMNIDLLSASAHKMYGPKGVGALFIRRGRPRVRLSAQTYGGGHERGFRSGTLAVPGIVGMGKAAELAQSDLDDHHIDVVHRLRDRLWDGLQKNIPGIRLNGCATHRLPNNLNVNISDVDAQAVMMGMREIACSSGAACASSNLRGSHVLRALGSDRMQGSIRFGVGRFNTESDIDRVLELMPCVVENIRSMHTMLES